eukprot:XP_019928080.1 PREDICTED: uncharacterized protein LOC105341173 isoform X1 [Crassostrea gigas]
METVFTVLQISFLFLFIDASYSDLCKSTEGVLECCPGYAWNRIEERCKKCDAGKFGPRCEKVCPYPNYGNLCVFKCDCNENLCNPSDGCSDKTNTSTTSSQKPRMLSLSSSNAERNNFTGLYAITKETSTPNVPYNDDHTYTDEEAQYHEESRRSQYMQFVTVSLAVLVVVMCIIYVGTKSIVRRRLSTDTTC